MAKTPKTPKRPAKIADEALLILVRAAGDGSGRYRLVDHAEKRVREREVTILEVQKILRDGHREPKKDKWKDNHKTWTYAVKGKTADERELRLAVTPDLDNPGILVITVIDTTRKDLH